jgi:disulfide bond formation protein DsbB
MYYLNLINFLFASGGLVLLVITIGLYVDYFFCERKYYKKLVRPIVWPILLATTIGGVVISLVYSEYFGYVPCSLCWLQRIALYPQALFSIMAIRTKEQVYFPLYSLALSLAGLAAAIYHYIYQMAPEQTATGGSLVPCLVDGSADCGLKVIEEFGFVTFPLLTAIMFAFLIVLYLNMRRSHSA